jgi:glycosyltransferase involved in cell wall biosynthesis
LGNLPCRLKDWRASELTEVLYDARWIGNHGIGRFARRLQELLPELLATSLVSFRVPRRPSHPLDPFLLGLALRRANPNLFFSPGYNPPVGWPGAFVFTLHDLNHLCVNADSNALKRAYYRYVIQPACHTARFVLTVSEYSRGEISAWAKIEEEKIINVGNGVGPPFTPIGCKYKPEYPYLLYVGSRKPHKNLSRLLQAYAISGVSGNVRLLLSGKPEKNISIEISRFGLNGKVVFADLSSDDRLSEAYRGALAFLFPSLYEGFGLPPLEAMACGVPVLTSNVCSLPEVAGDAALLVSPFDVEEIAEGIRRLVYDSALQLQLREKGLRRAKLFSWEETALKTSKVLKSTMGIRTEAELLATTSRGGI